MRARHGTRAAALLFTLGLAASACGSDGDSTATTDSAGTDASTATTEGGGTTEATTASSEAAGGAVDLSKACPATVVVQTDWFPESEHGALFQMLGDDYKIDADQKVVSGSLTAGGEDTGVDLEIRAGGPAIGDGNVESVMYTDDDVMLGYQSMSFHDALYARAVLGLRPAPEFEAWLQGIGIADESGRVLPTAVEGSPLRSLAAPP